jgi:hypothetical protein
MREYLTKLIHVDIMQRHISCLGNGRSIRMEMLNGHFTSEIADYEKHECHEICESRK